PHRQELVAFPGGVWVEGGVAPAAEVAAVHQPVVWLRVEEPLLGHRAVAHRALRGELRGLECHEDRANQDGQLSHRHYPPPVSKPGRPTKPPATMGAPSATLSGRAGSRRGAGPFTTRALSLRSNSEKWHEHLILLDAGSHSQASQPVCVHTAE